MTHSSVAVLGGTPTHIPPEKWKNYEMEPDVKLDVYSFGVMLWELCANEKPFARCPPGNLHVEVSAASSNGTVYENVKNRIILLNKYISNINIQSTRLLLIFIFFHFKHLNT